MGPLVGVWKEMVAVSVEVNSRSTGRQSSVDDVDEGKSRTTGRADGRWRKVK